MSDVMLFGVLRMPYEMAMSSELSRRQFYERAQEAANRLEGLDAEKWMPIETAPQDGTRVLLWAESKCRVGYWVYYPADAQNPVAPTHWMPLPPPPTDRRTPERSE